MKRRGVLRGAVAPFLIAGRAAWAAGPAAVRRCRPGDAAWPSEASWAQLDRQVGGRSTRIVSPSTACSADHAACEALPRGLKNPFFVGGEAGLTQSSGWLDA